MGEGGLPTYVSLRPVSSCGVDHGVRGAGGYTGHSTTASLQQTPLLVMGQPRALSKASALQEVNCRGKEPPGFSESWASTAASQRGVQAGSGQETGAESGATPPVQANVHAGRSPGQLD